MPAVNTADLARFVLITMEGAVMLARAYRSIEPYDVTVTQLRDYFERLLQGGTEWASPKQSSQPGETSREERKTS